MISEFNIIIEEHWSSNPNDAHTPDDADCTYVVANKMGECVSVLFSKLAEAEAFVKSLSQA